MKSVKHYEFLGPRGAGKSAYRDLLCRFLVRRMNIMAFRSRDAAFLSLGRKTLPPLLSSSPALSIKAGRIISKTFYERKRLEKEAFREFMEEYPESGKIVKKILDIEAEKEKIKSFMYWFTVVAGRYMLSRRYLKKDEAICYGGGFVFCLEHLFGAAEEELIEDFLFSLPAPSLLIQVNASESDLFRARSARGEKTPTCEKIRGEIYSTEKLSQMAQRQGLKKISFKNSYAGFKLPSTVKQAVRNSLRGE